MTIYTSRSAAVRAARNAAKKALGPAYEAAEGPDYLIHTKFDWEAVQDRYYFVLRGPALEVCHA